MKTEVSSLRLKGNQALVLIEAAHIERMYDRFDSGMADLSTANAMVIALEEIFGKTARIKTVKLSRGEWGVSCQGNTLPLPYEANQWMELLWDGFLVPPIQFHLTFPEELIPKKPVVRNSSALARSRSSQAVALGG